MSQEHVELLRAAYAAFDEGVEAALRKADEIAHPDIELRSVGRVPDATAVRGREAAEAWLAGLVQSEGLSFALSLRSSTTRVTLWLSLPDRSHEDGAVSRSRIGLLPCGGFAGGTR